MRREPGKNLTDKNGWPLRNSDILRIFGLPSTSPIPPMYQGCRTIGDTYVIIIAQSMMGTYDYPKRRVLALCNTCQTLVCAGHLHQHLKIHNKKVA